MKTAMKELTPPKGTAKLSDTEHANAVRMFILCDGDLDRTHRALAADSKKNKKSVASKKSLAWYAQRFNWYLTHEITRNDLVARAVEDATAKRKLDLFYLRETKSRLVTQILDGYEIEIGGETFVRQLRAKSLGEAVTALVTVIKEERSILGNSDGADDDRVPSLLAWVVEGVKAALEGDSDSDSGNGNKGGNGSKPDRFGGSIESGTIEDDDPFKIRD